MKHSPYELLKRPIVSEKSIKQATEGQYTFEVLNDATKIELAKAFVLIFPGRRVLDVHVVKIPSHSVRRGKLTGQTGIKRKAIFRIEGEPLDGFGGI
jgi:large subunit ribosomal protein L23